MTPPKMVVWHARGIPMITHRACRNKLTDLCILINAERQEVQTTQQLHVTRAYKSPIKKQQKDKKKKANSETIYRIPGQAICYWGIFAPLSSSHHRS